MSSMIRPIGLDPFVAEVDEVCENAILYKSYGLHPSNLIVKLDPGYGRSTAVSYMTDRYEESGVINFRKCYDRYIDVKFNGDLTQLKDTFADISAVYSNEYTNILAMDISSIAKHVGEVHFDELCEYYHKLCENAVTVFFFPFNTSRSEDRLISRLGELSDRLKLITLKPYTVNDIKDMILRFINERRISIEDRSIFNKKIPDLIKLYGASTPADAIRLTDMLVCHTDFSTGVATLRLESVTKVKKHLSFRTGGIAI